MLPVQSAICVAACSPVKRLRTPEVTSAPELASDLAVSMPMPAAPQVTMMRWRARSIPSSPSSSAVVKAEKGVVDWFSRILLLPNTALHAKGTI